MNKIKHITTKSRSHARRKVVFFVEHPFLLPVTAFFFIVFFGLTVFVAASGTTISATDIRIVDIYADGEHRTVSTRARTVAELLERLDVELIDEDLVEPARDTVLLEDNTQVNVYRARPISIIDGDRVFSVLSAQRAPRLLANEAGLELHPEDEVVTQLPEGSLLDRGIAEQIVVDRSVPVTLNAFGVLSEVRTTADTLGEFLTISGISLAEGETVQPNDLSTPIVESMLIAVNLPGVKTDFGYEDIPFDTEVISDSTIENGKKEIRTVGENGRKAVIYQITESEGVEVSRVAIQEVILKQPITAVEVRGTKLATLSPNISVSEDKAALMAAAGINPEDYVYVDYIVSRESGWRPGAANSSSGAYGLCQSLPASKMASAGADYLTNPVTQLRWCAGYASRYGGWAGAYNAWTVQHWW